jgi:hypothetical protein
MSHGYSHPSGGMYAQPRPDWAGYSQHGAPPLTPGHPVYAQSPASAPQQRPNQVRLGDEWESRKRNRRGQNVVEDKEVERKTQKTNKKKRAQQSEKESCSGVLVKTRERGNCQT